MPAQQAAQRSRRDRVHAVADDADQHKNRAQQKDLAGHRALRRIDELRQERDEEQRRLRIQQTHDDPFAEHAPQRLPLRFGDGVARVLLEQALCAEVDQDMLRRAASPPGTQGATAPTTPLCRTPPRRLGPGRRLRSPSPRRSRRGGLGRRSAQRRRSRPDRARRSAPLRRSRTVRAAGYRGACPQCTRRQLSGKTNSSSVSAPHCRTRSIARLRSAR